MDWKTLKDIPPWDWPEGTARVFLEVLLNRRAADSDRLLAAELAGDFTALESSNPEIHYEAVCAAGNWGVDAAWTHIAALVTSGDTDKPLLLAAIEAVAGIRPHEAVEILAELTNSDDEEIVEAVYEALSMAEGVCDLDDEDDEFAE